MGIPRLTSLLQPYFLETVIGCSNKDCQSHTHRSRPFVIDGPGLAYVVYYRLLASKPIYVNAVDAQPSYHEIGQAILIFLQNLTHCGLTMYYDSRTSDILTFAETTYSEKIYFDGYLPLQKRSVRISRLESYLKQMITFREKYKLFESASLAVDTSPIDATDLLSLSKPVPSKFRGLPAAPFLVPAVLDTLSTSLYADLIEVVPGEADSYCAAAAGRNGGILFTTDSDLLIHNLGPEGAVAFFDQLELQPCDEMSEHRYLSVRLAQPSGIADKLGIDNLCGIAYELKRDPSLSIQETIQRSKNDMDAVGRRLFQEFKSEYEDFQVQSPTPQHTEQEGPQSSIQLLDPRVSEMVLQCCGSSNATVNVYLPFLIEDPSRAAAWNVSSRLRFFAYSLIAFMEPENKVPDILEYSRRDVRIVPLDIHLNNEPSLLDSAVSLNRRLAIIWQHYKNKSNAVIWRIFGMIEVFSWYIESGRAVPSHEATINMFCGYGGKSTSWQDVQLSAQLQAALYSVRILKQILVHVCSKCAVEDVYLDLQRYLTSLPLLKDLIARPNSFRNAVSESEISSILGFIRSFPRAEAHTAELAGNLEASIQSHQSLHSHANDGDAWFTVDAKHKKRKKHAKTPFESRSGSMLPQKPTNNIYGMLANT
ncbi:hypothetical protein MMC13_001189 [Lambiella insularis]|nr:hypothetical protein [Lambiella insularis]